MWIIVLIMLSGNEMIITREPHKNTRRECMQTVRMISRLPDSNPTDRYECLPLPSVG